MRVEPDPRNGRAEQMERHMAGRLAGKVALVTGGASGIGRGCAERLAQEGAVAFISDLDDVLGRNVAQTITAAGGEARYLRHDVTDEDDWVYVIASIRQACGRLDIVVNNAGISIVASVIEMTLADWRRQTAVNLDGVFLGVKHSIPLMRASGDGGSIINMSSAASLKASPNSAGYCATKAAVRQFTRSVALQCARDRDGIRANSIHPGMIETPMWDKAAALNPVANTRIDLDAVTAQAVPLGFKGYPLDIANGVLWLASDESRYVTGAEIVIDGGLTIG